MAEKNTAAAAPKASAPVATPAKPKRVRVDYKVLYTSAEEAVKVAEERTKGPRRPFKCTLGDKTYYVVGHNDGHAGGVAFAQLGGKVEPLGARARKVKVVGVEGIMAAVNSLPEAERNAILEQLKLLAGGKK